MSRYSCPEYNFFTASELRGIKGEKHCLSRARDFTPEQSSEECLDSNFPIYSPRDASRRCEEAFSTIDHTRDRALILLLLRTGIRIGEDLSLTWNDIDLKERKVYLYQGEKNDRGRVVYLSNDAVFSLKRWFKWKDRRRRLFFFIEEAKLTSVTAPHGPASRNILRRQALRTKVTPSIVCGTPMPRSSSMPACVWRCSSNSWAIRISR